MHKPLALLVSRRFGPLFVTQFLGAANDNFFKNALVIVLVYGLASTGGVSPPVMGTLATAALVLPFFLFSATAGQIADRFDKARVIRVVKAVEIPVMALAAMGFVWGHGWFLIAILFLLGTQAAFFGPLKYAILPDHLASDDLVTGNALIEGGTFIAILLGTIAGGLLVTLPYGPAGVGAAMIVLAAAGYWAARRIPPTRPADPSLAIGWNAFTETGRLLREARQHAPVYPAILAISWFWLIGATYLSQFAAFAKEVLNADNHVVTLFLTLFSVGIAIGSLLCAKILKGEISARYVPVAAAAISLFSLDLALGASGASAPGAGLAGPVEFLSRWQGWRVVADLLLVSVFGGIYAVPLYAILQARSDEKRRARTIAANNVMNALFMTAGAGVTAGLLAAGLPIIGVFVLLAVINAAAVYLLARAFLPKGLPIWRMAKRTKKEKL